MSRQHHYLKIKPRYFMDIESGKKTFEIRANDRNFQVGDMLYLQEYLGGEYSGRELRREVVYMIDDPEYCKEGFVILGLGYESHVSGLSNVSLYSNSMSYCSSDATFVNGVDDNMDYFEILNWYRNLNCKEGDHTERGIMANAINELFMDLKNRKAEKAFRIGCKK